MKENKKIEKILIAGAGPAGAGLAIRLAKKDFQVTLIEREKFPRHKLCGEFISPECLAHFLELDVLGEMLSVGGDRISETVFYAPDGRRVSIPSKWFGGNQQNALSISRAEMDLRLLERARRLGVEILEENTVVDLLMENGAVHGIKIRSKTGETAEIRADLTIDATGRACSRKTRRTGTEKEQGDKETRRQGDKETNPKSEIRNPKSKWLALRLIFAMCIWKRAFVRSIFFGAVTAV